MNTLDTIRYFGLNNIAIEHNLRRLQAKLNVDLGKRTRADTAKDERYYPQFAESARREAATMANHYEIFYCLENSMRQLIAQRLEETGPKWWDEKVPEVVRRNAESNRSKEIGSGVTPRSAEMLAYTNFGELGEIIKSNWDIFSDTFSDKRAVEVVVSRLNGLRAPIAHCCPLAEDEILRLRLSVRDWFRLMSDVQKT
jgi:hypothetical protein